MSSDHGVAEEGVAGANEVEEVARVLYERVMRRSGYGGEGGAGGYESCEEFEVVVERVSQHEGVNLKKGGNALCLALEKV